MAFRLNIAATKGDWVTLLRRVEGDELLRFYEMSASGLDRIFPIHLDNLQGLGVARFGVLVQEDSYLALPTTESAVPRKIELNNGKIKYVLDQLTNTDSFIFRPGGIWESDCYIIGEIVSLHNLGLSITVAREIKRLVKKTFRFCGAYWIGPECIDLYSHCTFTTDCRYRTMTTL